MSELTSDKLCTNYVCYCAGIKCCSLGSAIEGGYLIGKEGGVAIILAPCTTQVLRTWADRNDAVTTAEANAACGDWFVPTRNELRCYLSSRSFWDVNNYNGYWSSTNNNASWAWEASSYGSFTTRQNYCFRQVRAFRKAYY
jgi:hypothetical protein